MMLMVLEFFVWWYSTGWLETLHRILARITAVWRMFSVPILVRTLFSPWRRIMSSPGRSVNQLFSSMIDNTVSRLVGFVVRLFVLIAAFFVTLVAGIIGLTAVVLWPLLPLLVVFFLLKGTML